jgi:hypothetical protein
MSKTKVSGPVRHGLGARHETLGTDREGAHFATRAA